MAVDASLIRPTVFVLTRGESQTQDYSWSQFKDGRVFYHCDSPPISGPLAEALANVDTYFTALVAHQDVCFMVSNRIASARRQDFMGRAIWTSLIVVSSKASLSGLSTVARALTHQTASDLVDRSITFGPDGNYVISPHDWDERIAELLASEPLMLGPESSPGSGVILLRAEPDGSERTFVPPRPLNDIAVLVRESSQLSARRGNSRQAPIGGQE